MHQPSRLARQRLHALRLLPVLRLLLVQLMLAQGLLLGLSAGVRAADDAARSAAAAFGEICSGLGAQDQSGTGGHTAPDCCDVGCLMFGPPLAPPPAAHGLAVPPPREDGILAGAVAGAVRAAARHSPGLPRAPPLLNA